MSVCQTIFSILFVFLSLTLTTCPLSWTWVLILFRYAFLDIHLFACWMSTVSFTEAGTGLLCSPLNPQCLAQHGDICWMSAMANTFSLCVRLNHKWTRFQCQLSRALQVTVFFQPGSLMLNPVKWSFLATPWTQSTFLLFNLGQGHKVALIMLNPAQKGLGSWNCLSKGLFCFCVAWYELIHGLSCWDHLSSQYYQCLCWGLDSTPFSQALIGQGVSLWKCFTELWFKSEIILIIICSVCLPTLPIGEWLMYLENKAPRPFLFPHSQLWDLSFFKFVGHK